jgi:hypothetical protein
MQRGPDIMGTLTPPDDVPIQAISADGVTHEFPAGTDTAVINKVMKDYATQAAAVGHPSFGTDIQGGLHDLGTATAEGLRAVGGVMQRNGMPQWGSGVVSAGDAVQSAAPDAPAGPSPSEQLGTAIRQGNWSAVPGLVAHSAVRALPSTAPIFAAGAVGGPVAAGVAAGAEALGPVAYSRAANNGRAEPTTGDVLGAVPGAVGEAVGGSLLPGGSRFVGPVARTTARVLKEAAGGAVMDTAGQLGGSVGTDQGAQLDPSQVAATALTQGAIGAGRSAPEAAGAGVKSASDQIMARTLEPPATPEDAASVVRVVNAINTARDAAVNNTGQPLPDTVLANSVKQDLVQNLVGTVRGLVAANLISSVDASDLRSLITNQALRHNNTITDGLGDVGGGENPRINGAVLLRSVG